VRSAPTSAARSRLNAALSLRAGMVKRAATCLRVKNKYGKLHLALRYRRVNGWRKTLSACALIRAQRGDFDDVARARWAAKRQRITQNALPRLGVVRRFKYQYLRRSSSVA